MKTILKNIVRSFINSLEKTIELILSIKMNKRNRLLISIVTTLLLFFIFRGLAQNAMSELLILGSSIVYGLGFLRVTGKKDYVALFGTVGILIVLSTFLAANVYENNPVSLSESFQAGTLLGFFIGGATTLLSLVYDFFTFEENKQA